MSRKLQYQKLTEQGNAERLPFIGVDELKIKKAKVVFQGEQGAYSEMAMWTFLNNARFASVTAHGNTQSGSSLCSPPAVLTGNEIKKAKVVFQGEQGAYSEMAMWTFFGENVDCFHVDTFPLPEKQYPSAAHTVPQSVHQFHQFSLLILPSP